MTAVPCMCTYGFDTSCHAQIEAAAIGLQVGHAGNPGSHRRRGINWCLLVSPSWHPSFADQHTVGSQTLSCCNGSHISTCCGLCSGQDTAALSEAFRDARRLAYCLCGRDSCRVDAGKVELDGARYLNFNLPFSISQLVWIEAILVGGAEIYRNRELDPEARIYPGAALLASPAPALRQADTHASPRC